MLMPGPSCRRRPALLAREVAEEVAEAQEPREEPGQGNASPLRSVMAALTGSPKRTKAPAEAALSLDARARKIKDERIARAKAQRGGVATEVPVAKRTRGYKIL